MSTSTITASVQRTASGPVLMLAFELGEEGWLLGFSTGFGQPVRRRRIGSRDTVALLEQIEWARRELGRPGARVVSCYEAGRDGFWLHRALTARNITNTIIDSASIEVNRRRRRDKSDRLDAAALLTLQLRAATGDRRGWHPVHVPTDAMEDWRHLHRELQLLTRERTRSRSRIKGLLAPRAGAQAAVAPEQILVVFRSLADSAELVGEVFERFGIPHVVARAPRLESAPIARALMAWLRLAVEDWPFRRVLMVLALLALYRVTH